MSDHHEVMMAWHGEGLTHKGLVRSSNQDAFAINNQLGFWMVADGMGGHAGGDIASRLAVDNIVAYLKQQQLDEAMDFTTTQSLLVQAIHSAGQAIHAHGQLHREYNGMGTTIVLLHISPSPTRHALVAHVGDSRAYLLRNGSISQLTRDHTFIEQCIQQGELTREQAKTHPMRHMLTRALGVERESDVEISPLHLQTHDRLLLCTDGLTKMMTDDHINHLVQSVGKEPSLACLNLVEEANRLGGEDNVTVMLIKEQ